MEGHKILIEADGQQHYKMKEFFGGIEGFIKQQKHDRLKTEYCTNNGYHLIRIKYNEDVNSCLTERIIKAVQCSINKSLVMEIEYE